jgi:hypothetical protein
MFLSQVADQPTLDAHGDCHPRLVLYIVDGSDMYIDVNGKCRIET